MDLWDILTPKFKEELVNEYGIKANILDDILTKFTKDYCKSSCSENNNIGCCNYDHYKISSPDEILQRQELESPITKSKEDDFECLYHSIDTGCALKSYKPLLCIGFLCNSLQNHILSFDNYFGAKFIDAMKNVGRSNLITQGELVLTRLDLAIKYGKKLEERVLSPKDL